MSLFKTSKRDLLMKDILNKRGESLSNDSSKGADTKKLITIVTLIFALSIVVVFGWYFLASEAGQRSFAEARALIQEYTLDPISDFYSGIGALGSGDYFDYSVNTSSKKMGIDLKDFRMVSGESLPAGFTMDFIYDIEYINVPRDSTYDAEFTCFMNITKKEDETLKIPEQIFGEIIPSSQLTIRRDSQPVCRILGDETKELDGAFIVYGFFSFDYATEDVTIPVYFISGQLADSLGDKDFFDEYGLDVSASDLKTTYNGEPLSIGIGVGGEGQEEQPVIIRTDEEAISYNTIGITIRNEWNGELLELYDFTLELPDGIELDDSLNGEPSASCPFAFTGQENRYNTYKMDESLVEFFDNYVASSEFFGKSNYKSFQCWLKIDEGILNNAPYINKEYKASIKYKYKIDEKQDSVSIIKQDQSLIAGENK